MKRLIIICAMALPMSAMADELAGMSYSYVEPLYTRISLDNTRTLDRRIALGISEAVRSEHELPSWELIDTEMSGTPEDHDRFGVELSFALGDRYFVRGQVDYTDIGTARFETTYVDPVSSNPVVVNGRVDLRSIAYEVGAGAYQPLTSRVHLVGAASVVYERLTGSSPDVSRTRHSSDWGYALDAELRALPLDWLETFANLRHQDVYDSDTFFAVGLRLRSPTDGLAVTLQAAFPDDAKAYSIGFRFPF
jgi:hypothetical protein